MNIDNTLIKTGMAKVDSHQHFWQLSRGDYSWLTPELKVLYQDFLPEQLAPELAAQGVNQTILVQAADTEAETHFLLDLATHTEFVAGVVGWIDMEAPLAITTLENLANNPYFKGIRPMLQDINDVNWILNDKFTPIFEFMVEKQLTFDALIKDIHLSNIYTLATRHPELSIVIDHCAKPDLSTAPSDLWKSRLTSIASCKNVSIKLSGLLTEAPHGQVELELLQPYFEHIMNVFGPDRIMWGSDWPVVNLNGDYNTWVSLTKLLLKNYSFEDKRKIWAGNTREFYHLPAY
jgi:L-fuconolactonase